MKTNEWVKWGKTFEELVYFIGEHEGTPRMHMESAVVVRSEGSAFFVGGRQVDWEGVQHLSNSWGEALPDSAIVDEYMIIT